MLDKINPFYARNLPFWSILFLADLLVVYTCIFTLGTLGFVISMLNVFPLLFISMAWGASLRKKIDAS